MPNEIIFMGWGGLCFVLGAVLSAMVIANQDNLYDEEDEEDDYI